MADMQFAGYQAEPVTDGAGRGAFDALVRNLINDKYNREYKLDKKTRAKAIEILTDYFAKHSDEATDVSVAPLFDRLSYLNLSFLLG